MILLVKETILIIYLDVRQPSQGTFSIWKFWRSYHNPEEILRLYEFNGKTIFFSRAPFKAVLRIDFYVDNAVLSWFWEQNILWT